jgi:hypothetical protein
VLRVRPQLPIRESAQGATNLNSASGKIPAQTQVDAKENNVLFRY